MPAVALSRVPARVVESGPGGENLATGNVRIDNQEILNTLAGFEEVAQGLHGNADG